MRFRGSSAAASRSRSPSPSPPLVVNNADRSARRKSTRRLVLHRHDDDDDDGEGDGIDEDEIDGLVARIYDGTHAAAGDDDGDDDDGDGDGDGDGEDSGGVTKGKTGGGRKRAKRKAASAPLLPPPTDGPDSFFLQNRAATRQQTSTATLAGLRKLDHAAYVALLRAHDGGSAAHVDDRAFLHLLHARAFGQWRFELTQGFNVLLYGYGSKRRLMAALAAELHAAAGRVVVVNGYLASLALKDVLATLARALGPATPATPATPASPATPATPATPDAILARLDGLHQPPLSLLVNSLDGPALRSPRAQAVLARLAAHPKLRLVATVDHVRSSLLWDAARASQFNFVWHDATTFEPYAAEIAADAALALVDGPGRAGGTLGVRFVLASLPANARALFRMLVAAQLRALADADPGAGAGGDAGGDPGPVRSAATPLGTSVARKPASRDAAEFGIEYRVLYQRALAEFVCSNEVAFRTLLKESPPPQISVMYGADVARKTGSKTTRWYAAAKTRAPRCSGRRSAARTCRASWTRRAAADVGSATCI